MTADLQGAPAVPSKLADLSGVPLGDIGVADLEQMLGRLLPDPKAKPVPVAAFNSAL